MNGKARPLTVTAPVAPDIVMFVPATIDVTPALVRRPPTLDRPVPSSDVNVEAPNIRFDVLAVINDE